MKCHVDNGSPWFIVGKNGQAQKPSEPTEIDRKQEKWTVSIANIRGQY